MTHMKRAVGLLTLAGALAAVSIEATEARAAGDDRIVLADGTSHEGVEILKEGHDKIRYKVKGSSKEINSANVVEIIHGDTPQLYGRAQGALAAGKLKRAVDNFRKAAEKGGADWVKPWALYKAGEAAEGLSADAADAAIENLETVINDYPEHYVYPAAVYALGQLLRKAGQADEAEEQYSKLEEGSYGDRWRMKGKFGKGMAMLARGANNEARIMFTQISDQASDPALISQAAFGIGSALINEKRYEDAITHFERLKEDAASAGGGASQVVGAALVGLAKSYLEGGPSVENQKKALLAYLEVVVLYSGAGDYYAEALYEAAQIYKSLKQPERAEELIKELKARCPDSEYASK